jgi:hypothetical protein
VLTIFRRPDQEIRREVTDRVIRQGLLMDPELLQVTVQDGIATLSGDQRDPADDHLHAATS